MKKTLLLLVLIDLALVAYSLVRFPEAGILHALPVLIIIILYGLATAFAGRWRVPTVTNWAQILGAAAGLVLGGEILLEYTLTPANNVPYGWAEYGLFALLLIAAGALTYRERASVERSAQAGLWTGMIGSLIWYCMLLLLFHLLFGTAPQVRVFIAEGNLDDFTRSGMNDFTTFIVQDFFGAGFFHLLLGALIGAGLGALGGLGTKFARRTTVHLPKGSTGEKPLG